MFEPDDAKHQAIREALDASLVTIEQHLATTDGPYWMGKQLTLVDLTFSPFFEHACVLSHYRGYQLPTKHKHLHQWLRSMTQRPPVQENCRDADFYIEAHRSFINGEIDH